MDRTGSDNLQELTETALRSVDKWLQAKEGMSKRSLSRTAMESQHPDAIIADGFREGGRLAALHTLRQDVKREQQRRSEL